MQHGNGKIANLPAEIRDELNYRLSDGDPGNELVEWLNSKSEVAEVVTELFDGAPISEQNLSEWRKRGYQKWLAHRNFVDESNALSDNTEGLAETGIDCDKLLLTLTAAYAEVIQNWIITPGEQMTYKLAVYKNLTNGVIALRRAEIQKVRLEIERERLELLREKHRNKSSSSSEPAGIGAGGMSRQEASEPAGVGAGGMSGQEASRSSCVSASADSASPESAPSSSPTRTEAPEPHRPVVPAPPPSEEADTPHPATAKSLPRSPAADAASQSAPSQERREPFLAASKPTTPQGAPFSPNRPPGGLPRNASPRNPLGLL